MECPVCKLAMIAVERHGIEVDYCISCRGFWFDSGEMNLLAESIGISIQLPNADAASASNESSRRCPRCNQRMQKLDAGSGSRTVIDLCPRGEGIWFDARELGAIVDAGLAASGMQRPVASFLGELFGSQQARQLESQED